MPGVQGLQRRVSRQRGHGDVQGRVPIALLRRSTAGRARRTRSDSFIAGPGSPRSPAVVNLVTQRPGFGRSPSSPQACRKSGIFRRLRRHVYRLVCRSVRARGRRSTRVLLWPDTFNNHFHPETAIAAVHVLERAGFRSTCRRWLLLRTSALRLRHARHREGLARDMLTVLAPDIEAGIPLVGLEPSCIAVFRHEMRELLPTMRTRSDWQVRPSPLRISDERGVAYPDLHRRASCTAIVTTRPHEDGRR